MRRSDDMELDGRQDLGCEDGYSDLPTKELLGSLFEQGKILLKEEVRLAKAEVRTEAKRAAASAGAIGAGGILLHTGLLVFAGFLVIALDLLLPLWAAALIVAVVLLGAGAFLAKGGVAKLKKVDLKPEQTLETLKEDKEWLTSVMRGGTSKTRATA
jgi:hypothetical protein